MKNLKDFPHPFETPIIEEKEIEVIKPVVDVDNKSVTFERVKEKYQVETTYYHTPSTDISCKNKKHDWYMKDIKKYIASCKKCMKNRFLLPTRHQILKGKICSRDTGKILE